MYIFLGDTLSYKIAHQINDVINTSGEGISIPDNSVSSSLVVTLITLLSINIISIASKLIVENIAKRKEKKLHKTKIIIEKRIQIEEKLYIQLISLGLLYNDQLELLISKIDEVNEYMRVNKLYIDKSLYGLSRKIIDYFLKVYNNYSDKNIKKENKFWEEYENLFNK